jgi:hypothetical protein
METSGQALRRGLESRPLPVLPVNRDMDRALCTKEPYLNTGDPRPARSPLGLKVRRNIKARQRGGAPQTPNASLGSPRWRVLMLRRCGSHSARPGSTIPPTLECGELAPAFKADKNGGKPPHSKIRRPIFFLTKIGLIWLVVVRHATRQNSLLEQELLQIDTIVAVIHPTRHNIIIAFMIRHFIGLCRLIIRHAETVWRPGFVARAELPVIHPTRVTPSPIKDCGDVGVKLRRTPFLINGRGGTSTGFGVRSGAQFRAVWFGRRSV